MDKNGMIDAAVTPSLERTAEREKRARLKTPAELEEDTTSRLLEVAKRRFQKKPNTD